MIINKQLIRFEETITIEYKHKTDRPTFYKKSTNVIGGAVEFCLKAHTPYKI